MRRQISFFIIFCVTALSGLACQQPEQGNVLVKAGDEVITDMDLELLAKVNPRLKRRLATPEGRKQVLDNYVEQSLMYQEALRQQLDKDPAMVAKIDLYRKVIMAQGVLDKQLEEAAREYYDDHKDEFEKIQLAHMYVPFKKANNRAINKGKKVKRNEAEAKKKIEDAKAELAKDPAAFDKLVEKFSEDDRTNKRGGELGWVTLNDARLRRWGWEKLAEKSFPLEEGAIMAPIRSSNGYHLLKIISAKKIDDFDSANTRIRFKIQAQIKSQLVDDLKKQYPVEFAQAEQSSAPAPAVIPKAVIPKAVTPNASPPTIP